MGRLDGKVALITGAAQSLGAEHVRTFVKEGAKVVISDILVDEGEQLAKELGDNALFIKLDVTKPDDWTNALEKTKETFGTVDILVNNAAYAGPQAKIADMKDEDYLKIIDVTQNSVFYGMKAVIPYMIEQGRGSIINIASIASFRHVDANPNIFYTTAKHAILGLTKGAALEYGENNIRVNAVAPGVILTPATKEFLNKEQLDSLASEVPLGKLADLEDVSKAVVFLASEDASYISGETIVVDGGRLAH
ncbi:SDR family NAD(P)-dependent oxidoreductase [Oceanobacillus zhaokaii]|uniref:SDR family NAD(P)-dependent oxidoreductase n=1 Tax=Oceanobacillus zhaokaii TaxID=2052660 RepID=UPI0019650D93|nr:glucose 1-dehydrogenase [Oceanobacillus zhaokaii]